MKLALRVMVLSIFILTACAPGADRSVSMPTSAPVATVTATSTSTPAPTATEAPTPTEVPKVLLLDATKQPGEWDLSGFTIEQQGWINQAMTDPDHAPKAVKDFYDHARIAGIIEQTGNANITLDKYVEYLFTNGIHEIAPLPFEWRKANLESVANLVPFNNNAKRGYLVEGYEGFGHDPNFGTPNELWSSVERLSTQSGMGENWSPFPTRDDFATDNELRNRIGKNHDRDTIFDDPSFLILPHNIMVRGDLIALSDIAGVNPDVAQEAIIRMYNEQTGAAQYTLVRVQYADESIQAGDNSCEKIPLDTSVICSPGTVVDHSILSSWDDPQRKHKVQASRLKMLELFTLFNHPPMITLQGKPFHEGGGSSNIFMDGAIAGWDVKIPSVPPEFFTK